MPDRENVIKGLECCANDDEAGCRCRDCPYGTNEHDTCDTMYHLLGDALKVLKKQKSEWIGINERLPDLEGNYLVSDGHKVWECSMMIIGHIRGWVNNARNPIVKYWMPLPEPPKEEIKADQKKMK